MNVGKLIGNTPMIKIDYEYEGKEGSIYTKLEYYNYSGSIKDRIASYIIEKEKENGTLKDGQAIVEVTSGNTGIAFSAMGALHGHDVIFSCLIGYLLRGENLLKCSELMFISYQRKKEDSKELLNLQKNLL